MPTDGQIQGKGGTESSFQFELTPPELQVRSTETRVEELLPDGTRIVRTYSDTQTLSRGRGIRFRSPLNKWVIILMLAIVSVVIGIVSAGPHEVWNWLTEIVGTVIR